jgi:hypothetical protein
MIDGMPAPIVPARVTDIQQVLADHALYRTLAPTSGPSIS